MYPDEAEKHVCTMRQIKDQKIDEELGNIVIIREYDDEEVEIELGEAETDKISIRKL
jgi:hypothetical protein